MLCEGIAYDSKTTLKSEVLSQIQDKSKGAEITIDDNPMSIQHYTHVFGTYVGWTEDVRFCYAEWEEN